MSDMYLIWSNEHRAWWNPNSSGYTTSSSAAGRYTRDEALKICFSSRDGWSGDGNPDEIPLREADVLELDEMLRQRNAS